MQVIATVWQELGGRAGRGRAGWAPGGPAPYCAGAQGLGPPSIDPLAGGATTVAPPLCVLVAKELFGSTRKSHAVPTTSA